MLNNANQKIDSDLSANQDATKSFADVGYPYPMGPLIPRPDANEPPLWPGLVKDELNRPMAAAEVLIQYYTVDGEWRDTRGEMKSRLDLSFCNWWMRVQPKAAQPAMLADIPLNVLKEWVKKLPQKKSLFEKRWLVEDKLARDLKDGYQTGRDNARGKPLLFAPPYYHVGRKPKEIISAEPWVERYGNETKQHIKQLLQEPAGEWNLLTLLFIKLLHAHMAWLAPQQIREQRQVTYYRPLLRQLGLCAAQVGKPNSHPLADTAVGIWQTLHRVNLLVSSGKTTDLLYPKHPDELNPRHELLPDSLHMDSGMGFRECISEVKQILRWMDTQSNSSDSDWTALIPWVDDVEALAWEMASVRTDPFALGGLGLVSDNSFKTKQLFKSFAENWLKIVKGVRARVHQLNGKSLTEKGKQAQCLTDLPSRFKEAFVPEDSLCSITRKEQIDQTIQDIELWAERPAQLRLFYQTTSEMLTSCGLNKFQSTKGTL